MTSIKTESNTLNKPDNITSKASGGEQLQKQNSKGKKRRPVSAKSKAARLVLREKSQDAKAVRERMIKEAKTPRQAVMAADVTLNSIIVNSYINETGCSQFKTFHDWKKAGYKVNKGESGFSVWGTPKRVKDKVEAADGEVLEGESWEFWPLCYLFNESQVSKNDNPEPTKKDSDQEETTPEAKPDLPESKENTIQAKTEVDIDLDTGANSPFVMVDYKDRQEAKQERLEERASKTLKAADNTYQRSRSLVEHIPFGQPILVGHHSERAHRNAVDKSWNLLGKSVGLRDKAARLEGKAASVGTGGISSNEPEALTKLKAKLDNLVTSQETMKAINKIVRTANLDDAQKIGKILKAKLLKSESLAVEILKPDVAGRIGFASYSLSNNNAEIRRINKCIESLEKIQSSSPIQFENDDFSMNVDNGQIVIDFKNGKPSEDTRTLVKRSAFKWSRYQTAWVRKITANAMAAANHLLEQLKEVNEIY